jgi:hypothetical protein
VSAYFEKVQRLLAEINVNGARIETDHGGIVIRLPSGAETDEVRRRLTALGARWDDKRVAWIITQQ